MPVLVLLRRTVNYLVEWPFGRSSWRVTRSELRGGSRNPGGNAATPIPSACWSGILRRHSRAPSIGFQVVPSIRLVEAKRSTQFQDSGSYGLRSSSWEAGCFGNTTRTLPSFRATLSPLRLSRFNRIPQTSEQISRIDCFPVCATVAGHAVCNFVSPICRAKLPDRKM